MLRFLQLVLVVGLVANIGCGPSSEYPTASQAAAKASSEPAPPPPPPAEETRWTQMVIPGMKSIKEDWPKVEVALKSVPGFREVRYKPTENDTIPENIALVKHALEFDAQKATAALGEAGYQGASVKGF